MCRAKAGAMMNKGTTWKGGGNQLKILEVASCKFSSWMKESA